MFPLRDENPTHSVPFFTLVLIAINVFVFFCEFSYGPAIEAFILTWGVIPREIIQNQNLPISPGVPPFVTLVTSMFLHGGFGHLIGNMWFLWIFGDNLEDFFGKTRFLFFYFGTGIIAGLVHVLLNPGSTVPTIGASGAVSGVLGAYVILYPRIRVRTLLVLGFFIQVIRVPAIFFLGLWFFMQVLGGLAGGSSIAFGAHIGGFVAGVVFVILFSKKKSSHPQRYDPYRRR